MFAAYQMITRGQARDAIRMTAACQSRRPEEAQENIRHELRGMDENNPMITPRSSGS